MNHERMLTLLIQDDLRYNAGFLIIVVDFSGFSTKHPEMLGTELTIDSPMTLYGRLHAGSTYPLLPSFTGEFPNLWLSTRGRAEILGCFFGRTFGRIHESSMIRPFAGMIFLVCYWFLFDSILHVFFHFPSDRFFGTYPHCKDFLKHFQEVWSQASRDLRS